jgi:hypothetical protein
MALLILCRVGGHLREHPWPKDGYGAQWLYPRSAYGTNRTQEQTLVAATMGLKDSAFILGYNATDIYGINGTNATRAWGTMTSDVFFIPERLRTDFIALSMHFVAIHLHTELITAYLMAMLSHGNHQNYVQLNGSWLWGPQRNNVSAWGLSPNGLIGNRFWLHAVKLSKNAHRVTRWWSDLTCL